MMKIIQFISIIILSFSCATTNNIVDTDDLYFSPQAQDTIVSRRIVRSLRWNRTYYTPNYGWYGLGYSYGYPYQYYQPRTIIITPRVEQTPNYGKRPSREDNHGGRAPALNRRGKD